MAIVGLDIGTAGCKATVVDESGNTLCENYAEYDLVFPQEGYVELDPNCVKVGIFTVLKTVAAAYGNRIDAIAVASFGEAAVLLDADGNALCNSIFYTDVRGNDQVEALCTRLGRAWLEDVTGMPVNGMYTLLKLMWLQKFRPEIFSGMRMILPFGAYAGYLLTGETAVDPSLASRTLMLSRRTGDWEEKILSEFGISREILPRIVPSGEIVGKVSARVGKELGLTGNPVVVSGAHDQVAAAVGAGVLEPGDAVDGIGSAECITAVLRDGINLAGMRGHNICAEPHAQKGRFVSLVFNSSAGTALKWYRNAFEEELRETCKREGKNVYAQLDAGVSASPSPLLFLPYLAGSGTPYMDSEAKGMLCGLTVASTKAQIYRAIMEGSSYEMKFNLELLKENGMEFQALTAVGGGAGSATLLQIKADILGMPISTLCNPQSGNMGAAMLCCTALGRYKSLSEAAGVLVKRKATIEPKQSSAYAENYERYKKLYPAFRDIYRKGN